MTVAMTMTVSHIVAMAENRIIGAAGGMPWHIPEDFKFFKAKTMGHAMIMGRKTFESIGRALPGRISLVVTRQMDYAPLSTDAAPVLVCKSVDEALQYAREHAAKWGDEVFVIGGGELYKATLPIVDKVYMTLVKRTVDGDTRYPELPDGVFEITESRDGSGDVPCSFRVLVRR